MAQSRLRFGSYEIDLADRRLERDGVPMELNARYFDALALLIAQEGRLVSKDRFMADVWRGVPVTDEALTQCVRTLRRLLGDDASAPRFIETVPKHGYRFVAPVEAVTPGPAPSPVPSEAEERWEGPGGNAPRLPQGRAGEAVPASEPSWRRMLVFAGVGTAGAAAAGIVGGLGYGLLAAAQPGQGSGGGSSVLLVLMSLTVLAALVGGAGVSFGMAVAHGSGRRPSAWIIAGGATGGLLVGGISKLLGLDAFDLLLGQAPGEITGAAEGALLGGSVGLAAWLAGGGVRQWALRRSIAVAALVGAAGGLLVTLVGGRLMGGSLDLLARAFPTSRVRLDHVGTWFGEAGFGPISQAATSALEGAVFAAGIVAALALARRPGNDQLPASISPPAAH